MEAFRALLTQPFLYLLPSYTTSGVIPDPQEGIWHILSYVKCAEIQEYGSSDQVLSSRAVELKQAAVGLGRMAHCLRR